MILASATDTKYFMIIGNLKPRLTLLRLAPVTPGQDHTTNMVTIVQYLSMQLLLCTVSQSRVNLCFINHKQTQVK